MVKPVIDSLVDALYDYVGIQELSNWIFCPLAGDDIIEGFR